MKQCGLRRKWLNEECEGQRNQGEGGQELWDGHSMCSSALEENKRVNEGQALGWQVARMASSWPGAADIAWVLEGTSGDVKKGIILLLPRRNAFPSARRQILVALKFMPSATSSMKPTLIIYGMS